MRPRLFPTMPPNLNLCFYPMNRLRGEDKNWYTLPMEERQRQMNEHGMVGRRYAGESLTNHHWFDRFRRLEMGCRPLRLRSIGLPNPHRRDALRPGEAAPVLFGSFFVGLRCPASCLHDLLEGRLPEHTGGA